MKKGRKPLDPAGRASGQVSTRIPPDLKARAIALAEYNGEDFSELVRRALEREVARHFVMQKAAVTKTGPY